MFIPGGSAIETGGYNINNSLRFRRSASAYLSRTPASASNRKTWTYSAWIKRGQIGAAQILFSAGGGASPYTAIYFQAADDLVVEYYSAPTNYYIITSQVFRDPSAWYHIVVVWDTTQATSSNRIKIYVNGNQVTSFSTAIYPAQNTDGFINNNTNTAIGSWATVANTFDGYYTEVNFIDGQALTPSSFGATDAVTGVWQPAAYTGSYGTNGFYLKFSDIATTSGSNAGLGKDFSGNGNYWTTNNISVTAGTTYDAMTDSPTLTSATVANYSTLNPLKFAGTLSNANLNLTATAASWQNASSTIFVNSGKWYFEATIITRAATYGCMVGIGTPDSNISTTYSSGDTFTYLSDATKYGSGSFGGAYGATFTAGDVIGVAFDCDAGTITFYKNNVSQGTAFSNLVAGSSYGVWLGVHTSASSIALNCGQRPFTYTPPTGFNRLNAYNLPDSTIKKGNSYMDATTYSGNGGTQSITNAGAFKPDLVWIKCRSAAQNNVLNDSVRGVSKYLSSNLTVDEQNYSGFQVTSFNTNGFTVVDNAASGYAVNGSTGSPTYVGWQWQAGQGTTSSNTSGSITSTVSVNTTAGFSIVTYTGTGANATVGHGLGVAPSMIIVKSRSGGGASYTWGTYHISTGATKYFELNTNAAVATASTPWNNTAPTSSVFNIGTWSSVNTSTQTYVAYCFTAITGFSAFGSYTGNGSADGPFIFTNFRPKFIMLKKSSDISNWSIFDTSRNPYNVSSTRLYPNLSNAEDSNLTVMDILSNGFKFRDNNDQWNTNAGTYIYAAFAENPFKNALAR